VCLLATPFPLITEFALVGETLKETRKRLPVANLLQANAAVQQLVSEVNPPRETDLSVAYQNHSRTYQRTINTQSGQLKVE